MSARDALARLRAKRIEAEQRRQQSEQLRRQAEAERDALLAQAKGDKGDKGDPGPMGPMPDHEWHGSQLRFERPDGWGPFVDLQGPPGPRGGRGGGGGGGTSGGTDLSTLPLADNSTIEQMVVRQNGTWRRMTFIEFLARVLPGQVYAGDAIVVAGTDTVVTE